MQASELEPLVGGTGTDTIDGVVPEGDEREEDMPDLKIAFRSEFKTIYNSTLAYRAQFLMRYRMFGRRGSKGRTRKHLRRYPRVDCEAFHADTSRKRERKKKKKKEKDTSIPYNHD